MLKNIIEADATQDALEKALQIFKELVKKDEALTAEVKAMSTKFEALSTKLGEGNLFTLVFINTPGIDLTHVSMTFYQ